MNLRFIVLPGCANAAPQGVPPLSIKTTENMLLILVVTSKEMLSR